MKKKVTYIISNIHKALAFEWIAQELDKNRFELSFILMNEGPSTLETELEKLGVRVHRIKYAGSRDMPLAFMKLLGALLKNRPDMVHVHLFDAGLLGLTAAYALRIKKRIYTRHNAIYHIDDYPHMVKYDRYINAISTHIVAISDSVKKVMVDMEGANPDKITSIPHGFKLEAFEQPDKHRVEAMKMTYQTVGKHPVIGVVSRYTRWKGVHFIIEAFQELLKTHPNAYLVLANANGDYRQPIQQLLKRLPPDSFVEIPFEEDLYSLYQLFDIYVHVPIKPQAEAFGQTYVEALAAGIPSVVTLSGIACEFIKDQENAVVVNYEETVAIHKGILSLLDDKKLRDSIIKNGHEDVKKYFGLNKMITSLENLYEC